MSILHRIAARAVTEVETVGGLRWRIQRISTEDMAALGHATLTTVPREVLERPVAPEGQSEAATLEEQQRLLRRFSEADLRKIRRVQGATVCAAVTHVYDDEAQEWEAVTVVQGAPSDADAGRLNLKDLPEGVEQDLVEQIDAWQAGGEAGLTALRTFRDGRRAAAAARQAGPPVRATAKRNRKAGARRSDTVSDGDGGGPSVGAA